MLKALTVTLGMLSSVAQAQSFSDLRDVPWANGSDTTTVVPTPPKMLDVTTKSKAPKLIGGSLALAGGLAMVGSLVFYVQRQNYRLMARRELTVENVEHWETQGAISVWLGLGGSAAVVASEYLLLPESKDVPTLAWIGGAVGVGVAAVGLGYLGSTEQCGPVAIQPGTAIRQSCFSATADPIFGRLLLSASMPLINLPLTYLLRDAFSGPAESLTLAPNGVTYTKVF